MTSPRQSREDRSADQLLAGKYVLGLLSEEKRRDVETRMRRDRGFARIVMQWSRNMASGVDDEDGLNRRHGRPAASDGSYPRLHIRKRDLFILLVQHIWCSVAVWRSVSLLLFVLVLTLIAA